MRCDAVDACMPIQFHPISVSYPCTKCTCPDFQQSVWNDTVCGRNGCGHSEQDHGMP
jgi:hypothetical protein